MVWRLKNLVHHDFLHILFYDFKTNRPRIVNIRIDFVFGNAYKGMNASESRANLT